MVDHPISAGDETEGERGGKGEQGDIAEFPIGGPMNPVQIKCSIAVSYSFGSTNRVPLRHNRKRQIVPVTAFVVGLKVVAIYGDNCAVGQIAERATHWIGRGVADQC